MARVCEICGKRTETGNKITRRGLAKAKGGVGKRVTGKTKRKFKPNVQRVRAEVGGGVLRLDTWTTQPGNGCDRGSWRWQR